MSHGTTPDAAPGAEPGSHLPSPFAGGGEVGVLAAGVAWEHTALGPVAGWPQSLRTTVRIMLTSRFAMWTGWGPELTFLYNDAYARMTLGAKHPWALGRPAHVVWAEIWRDLEPRVRQVMETGTATWDEALRLFLERSGYREETYHTFSYSPLADDGGRVSGLFCVVVEETDRVIGERRLDTLRELAARLAAATREEEVLAGVAGALGANGLDLPFTLTYLLPDDESDGPARLACATGTTPGAPVAPAELALDAPDALWPLGELLAPGGPQVREALGERVAPLPTGAWDEPPQRAVIVRITQGGQERPAGFFIAGVSPFRPLDAAYLGFVELVAGQIAAALGSARAYEQERRRAAELAALDRAKTEFFSNVSHEFRTPLTLLLGPSEDIAQDPEAKPLNRERATVVHRNALRLLRLVNSLLDFSRIEAGRVRARYEPTDLAAFTAELASSFRSATERAGLRLVVDAPPLPPALGPVYVDREMWEKVVFNLLSNAFKHTFEGEIAVRVGAASGRAVLTVRDTGVGIPAEQLPHLFERFHRVPNALSRTHEGTGIGLALVRELVLLHGGTIDVASTVGEGTTFVVSIPSGAAHLPAEQVATGAEEARGAPGAGAAAYVEEAMRWLPGSRNSGETRADDVVPGGAEVPGRGPSAALAGARVLVADDNADMREYVARLLRDRGVDVQAVGDGEAALAAAAARPPELILSDVMMPGLDGFALIAALRADPRTARVPVVLLSARAGEEARVEGLESGAEDYLVKPFSARELVARVEGRLQLDRARRAAEAEQERLLARVQAERERLQALIAQAPAAIAVLEGPSHVFASANALYHRLVGREELRGHALLEVFPELGSQGIVALLDDVYRTGRPHVANEMRVLLATGGDGVPREHWFSFVYQPITEADDAVSGIFVLAVDVSDQVRAREAAERAQHDAERAREEAEAANRAKSDFLAAMSHELRTPLNAIGGYAQLLELEVHGPVTDAQRAALERVQRSQQHLLALINDVLNFAKLEAGRVEYDVRDVALDALVAGVAPMIEPQLAARGLRYVVDVPPLTVRADAERVQQILLNLLSNAVKFTAPGGELRVDASEHGGIVALHVRDTGIGIAPEKLEEIFDPFVQAHRNLTTSTPGTGLGLSISRDLARGMAGDLTVESRVGVGSTFTLTLPGHAGSVGAAR